MSFGKQIQYLWTHQSGTRLILLSLFLAAVAGCAQVSTPPVEQPEPSPVVTAAAPLPAGWETYTGQGQCGYAISHPADMQGASQGTYSWILSPSSSAPSGPAVNFVYVSVIPDGFQAGPGDIYNYDPADMATLLTMQVGESTSLRADLDTASWFTYTRLADAALSDGIAQAYENSQPWEFPAGTKELRYVLKSNGCTFLIGGYLDTQGSDSSGPMDQARFDQMLATFRAGQ